MDLEAHAAELRASVPKRMESPHSLLHITLHSYLTFLENECATYVMLTTLNSALWNPVKDKLMKTLKAHLRNTFQDKSQQQSGLVRTLMIDRVLSGKYPSVKYKNPYFSNDQRFTADADDEIHGVTKTLEQVKLHGRNCSSVCCTGAFIAETMLTVLVSHLVFESDLKDRFYKDKPIRPFLFFDVVSVLVHYILALDNLESVKTPALTKLIIDAPNIGGTSEQVVYQRLLNTYQGKLYD